MATAPPALDDAAAPQSPLAQSSPRGPPAVELYDRGRMGQRRPPEAPPAAPPPPWLRGDWVPRSRAALAAAAAIMDCQADEPSDSPAAADRQSLPSPLPAVPAAVQHYQQQQQQQQQQPARRDRRRRRQQASPRLGSPTSTLLPTGRSTSAAPPSVTSAGSLLGAHLGRPVTAPHDLWGNQMSGPQQSVPMVFAASVPPPHIAPPPGAGSFPRHTPFQFSMAPPEVLKDACRRAGAPPGEYGLDCVVQALRRLRNKIEAALPSKPTCDGPSPWLAVCDHLDSYGGTTDRLWEALRTTVEQGVEPPPEERDVPRLMRKVMHVLSCLRPSLARPLVRLAAACDARFRQAPAQQIRQQDLDARDYAERRAAEVKARMTHNLAIRAAIERTMTMFQNVLLRAIFASWRSLARRERIERVAEKRDRTFRDFKRLAQHNVLRQEANFRADQAALKSDLAQVQEQLDRHKRESEMRYMEKERQVNQLREHYTHIELEHERFKVENDSLVLKLSKAEVEIADLHGDVGKYQELLANALMNVEHGVRPRSDLRAYRWEQRLRAGLLEVFEKEVSTIQEEGDDSSPAPPPNPAVPHLLAGFVHQCAEVAARGRRLLPATRTKLEGLIADAPQDEPSVRRDLARLMGALFYLAPNLVEPTQVQAFLAAIDPVEKAAKVLSAAQAAGLLACDAQHIPASQLVGSGRGAPTLYLQGQIALRVLDGQGCELGWYDPYAGRSEIEAISTTGELMEWEIRANHTRAQRLQYARLGQVIVSSVRAACGWGQTAEPGAGGGAEQAEELSETDHHLRALYVLSPETGQALKLSTEDFTEVNAVLRQHFRLINDVFQCYALSSSVRVEERPDALPHANPVELETMWRDAGANWAIGPQHLACDQMHGSSHLSASGFAELLVRIAKHVSGHARGAPLADSDADSDSPPPPLAQRLARIVVRWLSRANRIQSAAFRALIHSPPCEHALDRFRPQLRKVFRHYAGATQEGVKQGQAEHMTLKEFRNMLSDAKALGGDFSHWQAQMLFVRMQTEHTFQMEYSTFVDAVCAVAAWKDPAPYMPLPARIASWLEHSFLAEIGNKIKLTGPGTGVGRRGTTMQRKRTGTLTNADKPAQSGGLTVGRDLSQSVGMTAPEKDLQPMRTPGNTSLAAGAMERRRSNTGMRASGMPSSRPTRGGVKWTGSSPSAAPSSSPTAGAESEPPEQRETSDIVLGSAAIATEKSEELGGSPSPSPSPAAESAPTPTRDADA